MKELHKEMSKNLPVITQTIIYRKTNRGVEVLLLKRNAKRGNFWNAVNGTLEISESVEECRVREIREETGIAKIIKWTDEVYRFYFPYKDFILIVLVFGAQVPANAEIQLNEENTEFRWLPFNEAEKLLKFKDDKKALQLCYKTIIS